MDEKLIWNHPEEIKTLWKECFQDSEEWRNEYFEKIFKEEENVFDIVNGELASSLMLMPYKMNYEGECVNAAYLMGAMTAPKYRNKGYMSNLLKRSLDKARKDGNKFVMLIPENEELYFFYDKFGFATVFFRNDEYYTEVHNFKGKGECNEIIDWSLASIYEFYHDYELKIFNRVIHSKTDMENILWDIELDKGKVIVAERDNRIVGIAFTVPTNNFKEVLVKEICCDGEDVRNDLLEMVKNNYPGWPLTVRTLPKNENGRLKSCGMIRITDCYGILNILASRYIQINTVIKITDNIIDKNNGIYRIKEGKCELVEDANVEPDSDIDIKVMAEVIFNTPATGKLFGLVAHRPSMSLMLE